MTDLVDRHRSPLWFNAGDDEHRPNIFGHVVSYEILRQAIDACPTLFSARLSLDYQAIMVELNRNLPDGRMVSIEDVKKAMDLRPVPQPTGTKQATGFANKRGGQL